MAEKLVNIGYSVDRLRGSDFDNNEVQEIGAKNNALYTAITDTTTGDQAKVTGDGFLEVNLNGSVDVSFKGMTDPNNSTTTNLTAGEVFTGTGINIDDYVGLSIHVRTDVEGTLEFQLSHDGATYYEAETYIIEPNLNKYFTPPAFMSYCRLVYTNGDTVQTSFSLHLTLHKSPIKWSSHNINDSITRYDDAELTKTVLTGEDVDGNFKNITATRDTYLETYDRGNGLSISQGKISTSSPVNKFGYAGSFDYSDGIVTIWDGSDNTQTWGNPTYIFSTTADIDKLVSSSDSDIGKEIRIYGLDTDFKETNFNITCNGKTPVTLSTNLSRVYRMENIGFSDMVGTVFTYVDSSATAGIPDDNTKIRAIIQNGNNQTLMSVYTVPDSQIGYMRQWKISLGGGSVATNESYTVKLLVRPYNRVFQVKDICQITIGGNTDYTRTYNEPFKIDEKSDVILTVESKTSGSTGASISGIFDLVIEEPVITEITGDILQENGFNILQENGSKLLR